MSLRRLIFVLKKSMSQLSRLISILTLLRSKRLLTATELAKKFSVSLRTIYRDIRKLDEAGIPIITIDGRGYSIMEGYNVSPLMFEQEEANALITAEKLIATTNDKSLIENFEKASVKIKSIFRSTLQSKSELLNDKMVIFDNSKTPTKSNSLSSIQMAITNFLEVEINYQKEQGEKTFRKIEPMALYCYNEKWIVIAWCRLRDDYRAFRLDRIQNYRILDTKFEDRGFDLRAYFLSCPEINY